VTYIEEHERTRRRLLEGEGLLAPDGHAAICPSCRELAAALAAIDRLAGDVPEPRPGLLGDILARTRPEALGETARPRNAAWAHAVALRRRLRAERRASGQGAVSEDDVPVMTPVSLPGDLVLPAGPVATRALDRHEAADTPLQDESCTICGAAFIPTPQSPTCCAGCFSELQRRQQN